MKIGEFIEEIKRLGFEETKDSSLESYHFSKKIKGKNSLIVLKENNYSFLYNNHTRTNCELEPILEKIKLELLLDIEGKDMVNNPEHYGGADNVYEVVKVLEAWGLHKCAYLFSAVKYIARAGKKDPSKEIQDLEKAIWMISRKVNNLKKEQS